MDWQAVKNMARGRESNFEPRKIKVPTGEIKIRKLRRDERMVDMGTKEGRMQE